MLLKHGVVALGQHNKAMPADFLYDRSCERARRRSIGRRAPALENLIRVISDLWGRRDRRRTQERALDGLVRIKVVDGTRIAAPAQEHREHTPVAAVRRTAEHAAVCLLQIVDVP